MGNNFCYFYELINNNNNAEYLNTNYKKDQLVNTVKNHENTQPAMNSVIRLAAKIMEELGPLQGQREATPEDR